MTETESKVLKIIWDWGGEASVDIIAREAKTSIDYTRLICQNLGREDYIDFLHSKLAKLKHKGKLVVARKRSQGTKKIVIPESPSEFGKDKRGRLLLNY